MASADSATSCVPTRATHHASAGVCARRQHSCAAAARHSSTAGRHHGSELQHPHSRQLRVPKRVTVPSLHVLRGAGSYVARTASVHNSPSCWGRGLGRRPCMAHTNTSLTEGARTICATPVRRRCMPAHIGRTGVWRRSRARCTHVTAGRPHKLHAPMRGHEPSSWCVRA